MPTAATPGSARTRAQDLAIARAAARLVVLHERRIGGDEQLPVVAEAGIGRRRLQRAAREQAAGREQHQRQRDLADDHHVARREAAAEHAAIRPRSAPSGPRPGRSSTASAPGRGPTSPSRSPRTPSSRRRRSRRASARTQSPSGRTAASDRASAPVAHDASSSPPAAPASASSSPSVSSCRTIRPRPPPTASRIAISLRRAAPRASSMLAMFRQAMSSTTPESAISAAAAPAGPASEDGDVLVPSRGSGFTVSSCSLFSAGYARSSWRDSVSSRGAALATRHARLQPAGERPATAFADRRARRRCS